MACTSSTNVFLRPKSVQMSIFKCLRPVKPKDSVSWPSRRRNLNRGSCRTLILDLKTTPSNFFSTSDTFQIHRVLLYNFLLCFRRIFHFLSVSNFLACKTTQSVFLHYRSLKRVSKTIAYFLAFYSKFLHKIIQKGILVISCSGIHFSPYNLSLGLFNLSAWIINQLLSKNHLSIASESAWVNLSRFWSLRGILVFSHQIIFLTERYFKIPHFGSLFVLVHFVVFLTASLYVVCKITFFYQFYFTFFLQISPNVF